MLQANGGPLAAAQNTVRQGLDADTAAIAAGSSTPAQFERTVVPALHQLLQAQLAELQEVHQRVTATAQLLSRADSHLERYLKTPVAVGHDEAWEQLRVQVRQRMRTEPKIQVVPYPRSKTGSDDDDDDSDDSESSAGAGRRQRRIRVLNPNADREDMYFCDLCERYLFTDCPSDDDCTSCDGGCGLFFCVDCLAQHPYTAAQLQTAQGARDDGVITCPLCRRVGSYSNLAEFAAVLARCKATTAEPEKLLSDFVRVHMHGLSYQLRCWANSERAVRAGTSWGAQAVECNKAPH